jgi:organic radical activating enzyme
LHCAYCDTPQRPAAEQCAVEPTSGASEKRFLDNPVSVDAVLNWILHFHAQAAHHSVSFTGGEPLLYTDFMKVLLPQIKPILPIYLETSGTQPDKLAEILPWVDIIAMDIKLPSATDEPMQLENHQAFYQLSRAKEHFVKLVFSNNTPVEEVLAARQIVTDPKCTIILQPMTDLHTSENTVSAAKIFELYEALVSYFQDVRVIPQTHKLLSLL